LPMSRRRDALANRGGMQHPGSGNHKLKMSCCITCFAIGKGQGNGLEGVLKHIESAKVSSDTEKLVTADLAKPCSLDNSDLSSVPLETGIELTSSDSAPLSLTYKLMYFNCSSQSSNRSLFLTIRKHLPLFQAPLALHYNLPRHRTQSV
jgi:hypothetical protein